MIPKKIDESTDARASKKVTEDKGDKSKGVTGRGNGPWNRYEARTYDC